MHLRQLDGESARSMPPLLQKPSYLKAPLLWHAEVRQGVVGQHPPLALPLPQGADQQPSRHGAHERPGPDCLSSHLTGGGLSAALKRVGGISLTWLIY